MKPNYVFLLAILITGNLFAQSIKLKQFKKQVIPVAILNNNEVKPAISTNVLSQSKDINAVLNQNFDNIGFPPYSWSVTGAANTWYNSGSTYVQSHNYEAPGTPNGHFAYFDSYELNVNVEGSLITPVLHPTTASNTFTYKVNDYLLNSDYIASGAKLYIEFSTNGGTSWTTSTTNELASLPNYNSTTTGWQTKTVSLSAYNNGTVQVRFRAISDYGGFSIGIDDVTGPEADITIPPADLVVTPKTINTMIPLQHATYTFSADVSNVGGELTTSTNLNITATPGGYSDALAITVPMGYGNNQVLSSINNFTPTTKNTYTVTFTAPVTGDPTPANNTVSQSFAVTDSTWATDNGTITNGVGSGSPLTIGNLYAVLTNEIFHPFQSDLKL